jgi:ABC-type ATPase involved in cell division
MIELVGVRLDHPRTGEPLVRRADLAVAGGEVVVVGGSAGMGASRLVAALLGEAPVAEGRIAMLGRELRKLRRAALRNLRRSVGVVPQELCLLGDRTAIDNAILPLEIDGVPRDASRERAQELLTRLGLPDDGNRFVDEMAWSSRQRVAVARALIRKPAVILADQPTSLQDETGCNLVCSAFAAAAEAGCAVLVFGRDPLLRREAMRRGWRQMTLDDGYLGARTAETLDFDDVSLDMVIEQLSSPTRVAGQGAPGDVSIAPLGERAARGTDAPRTTPAYGAPVAARPAVSGPAPAAPAEDEADSDGIPRGVLPFPISARSASLSGKAASDQPEPAASEWREAGAR